MLSSRDFQLVLYAYLSIDRRACYALRYYLSTVSSFKPTKTDIIWKTAATVWFVFFLERHITSSYVSVSHDLIGTALCYFVLTGRVFILVHYATRLRTVPPIFDQLIPARLCYHCAVGKSYHLNALTSLYVRRSVLLFATSFLVRKKRESSYFRTFFLPLYRCWHAKRLYVHSLLHGCHFLIWFVATKVLCGWEG